MVHQSAVFASPQSGIARMGYVLTGGEGSVLKPNIYQAKNHRQGVV